MEKSARKKAPSMTVRQLGLMFVFFFLANCLVIYFAHQLFPANVVLGTYFHTLLMALVYSMVFLTLVITGAVVVIEDLLETTRAKLTELHWVLLSFLLNFVGLWVTARLADILGLGIRSWRVVAVLAIILGLFQRALVKTIIEKA